MGKTLYLEGYSGVSAAGLAGMLLDLGADAGSVMRALSSLRPVGCRAKIRRLSVGGLDVCDYTVVDAGFAQDERGIPDVGRHDPAEISEMFSGTDMTCHAREFAVSVCTILKEAYSGISGRTAEEVSAYEIGSIRDLAEMVTVAVCLDDLEIDKVLLPALCEGTGFTVRPSQDICYPVPHPAVTAIAGKYGIPLHLTGDRGELVTPAGAAIVAAMRSDESLPDTFQIDKCGMGALRRQSGETDILRGMLIRRTGKQEDRIIKLECNIDDCTGEALGYTMSRLLENGARDVHYIPVFMKKNRPAWQLNVICDGELVPRLEEIIFEETTTIGIRRVAMDRTVLKRQIRMVHTPVGEAAVKVCEMGETVRYYPEYDSVSGIARSHGLPFREVYDMVRECADK